VSFESDGLAKEVPAEQDGHLCPRFVLANGFVLDNCFHRTAADFPWFTLKSADSWPAQRLEP
jgi:hypothetical protein